MRIYNGFSVSNGIVYGKVVTLFYEKNFIQDKISDNEKEREIIRFENLLSSYLEVDRVKVDDKKLENLLNVHIELIDDPFLKDTVKNKILTENKSLKYRCAYTCAFLDRNAYTELVVCRVYAYEDIVISASSDPCFDFPVKFIDEICFIIRGSTR